MMEMSADRCGEVNSISSHIHPYYLHVLTREVGALLCRWPKTLIFYYIFVLCGRVGHWSLWVHCQYIYTVFAFSFNQFSILDWEDTFVCLPQLSAKSLHLHLPVLQLPKL